MEKPFLHKTYVIITPIDEYNIICGRCPNYALNWGIKKNIHYWSKGHDFINGKYSTKNIFEYPKNSITIDEYDKLRREKENFEKQVPKKIKEYYKIKRETMKNEMDFYV
jgi:hypothetical protein